MKLKFVIFTLISIMNIFPSFSAVAETTWYGKILLALENIDKEATISEPDNIDVWEVSSHASRFGVKGELDTNHESLKFIYQLAWQIDVTDEGNGRDNHIKSRDQYAGLAGGFGKFVVGRLDTPLKNAQGKLDLFNEFDGDITAVMSNAEVRVNNVFRYTSPKIADSFTFTFMGSLGEEDEQPDPNADVNNGLADATSTVISYDDDRYHIALAADSNIAGENIDTLRAVGTVKIGNFGVGALWQETDYATTEEVSIFSIYYKKDKLKFKGQIGSASNYAGVLNSDADLTSVGIDYDLGGGKILGTHLTSREGGDGLEANQSKDTFGFNIIVPF